MFQQRAARESDRGPGPNNERKNSNSPRIGKTRETCQNRICKLILPRKEGLAKKRATSERVVVYGRLSVNQAYYLTKVTPCRMSQGGWLYIRLENRHCRRSDAVRSDKCVPLWYSGSSQSCVLYARGLFAFRRCVWRETFHFCPFSAASIGRVPCLN